MSKRLMVLGGAGMLGTEVTRAAEDTEAWKVHRITHADLDITDAEAVRSWVKMIRPDVVINCAGLTKHRDPEPTADEYRRVNTLGPLLLARECDRIGARLIHVSTDCVFQGTRPVEQGAYTEADVPDATDDYGRSKADGEVTGAPHLTVRCSFVGLGEHGLIAWLRGLHPDGVPTLWGRAYWFGSTAPAIARALVELAQRPETTGVMHLASSVGATKASLVMSIWQEGLAPRRMHVVSQSPVINRWLATTRTDVPVLPPLHEALRELAEPSDWRWCVEHGRWRSECGGFD